MHVNTACGVGACGSTGTTSCVSGTVVDTCLAGTPAPADATCDGADDECEGAADEDYASTATTCGVGACGSTGSTSCVSGSVVDSCVVSSPATSDATCDNVDDDCDGTADEDYVSLETTCGVGACGSSGTTSCVSGTVVDTCLAGPPAPADATCDAADDDCDGTADEHYVSLETTCGVGACGSEGDLATIFEQCMQARKRPAPRTDSTPAADAAKFSELLTQSREALKRGLYDQAHQLCRQALAIQPKDPHALEVCALAACCVGNAAEAKGYYAMMIGQRQRQSRVHQFCLIRGIELAR